MFKILKAVETAKSEKNKYLRFFYLNYVKFKLKNTFFKRFDKYMLFNDILNTRQLIGELWQLITYKNNHCCAYTDSNKDYVYLSYIHNYTLAFDNIDVGVNYHGYYIVLSIYANQYTLEIRSRKDTNSSVESWHYDGPFIPHEFIKEIIFMAIYNYCVYYIYGKNSKLYKDDLSYIKQLEELF